MVPMWFILLAMTALGHGWSLNNFYGVNEADKCLAPHTNLRGGYTSNGYAELENIVGEFNFEERIKNSIAMFQQDPHRMLQTAPTPFPTPTTFVAGCPVCPNIPTSSPTSGPTTPLLITCVPAPIFPNWEELIPNQLNSFYVGNIVCPHSPPPPNQFEQVPFFSFHLDRTVVQSIVVNRGCRVGDEDPFPILSVQIILFGGTKQAYGITQSGACSLEPSQYTFAPGEGLAPNSFVVMSYSATLSFGISFLQFTTTSGNTFSVGNPSLPKFSFPIGTYKRRFTGIFGQVFVLNPSDPNNFITGLGFYFSKGITSEVMTGLQFPDLALTLPANPSFASQQSFSNPTDTAQSMSYSSTFGVTVQSCFTTTITLGYQISFTFEVSGGIPLVGEAKTTAGFVVNFGIELASQSCTTGEKQQAQTFDCAVPPFSVCTCSSAQWVVLSTDIPYTAFIHMNYADGSFIEFPTSGKWTGVSASSAIENINCNATVHAHVNNLQQNKNAVVGFENIQPTSTPTALSGQGGGTLPTARRALQTCYTSLQYSYVPSFEELVKNLNDGNGVGAVPNPCLPGFPFDFHQDQTSVRTISINNCDPVSGAVSIDGFTSISITLFSGLKEVFGNSAAAGECAKSASEFTFEAGELLASNSFLTMSAVNNAVGYLSFTTTKGRVFAVGSNALNKYSVPIGSYPRYLTGLYGFADQMVYDLAAYLSYGVVSSSMRDITFPAFPLSSPTSPTIIAQQRLNNPSSIIQAMTYPPAVYLASTNCFTPSLNAALQIASGSVHQGLFPALLQSFDSGSPDIVFQPSETQSNCLLPTFPAATFTCSAPAGRSCLCTTIQYYLTGTNVPFTGTIVLQLNKQPDGILTVATTGTWSGSIVSEPIESVECSTDSPSFTPSALPTPVPSALPTNAPSATPSTAPTSLPSPM